MFYHCKGQTFFLTLPALLPTRQIDSDGEHDLYTDLLPYYAILSEA